MSPSSVTPSAPIGVIIVGASGNMGREAVQAVLGTDDLTLLAAISPSKVGEDAATVAGLNQPCGVPLSANLDEAHRRISQQSFSGPVVALELTHPEGLLDRVQQCITYGWRPVVGASGLAEVTQTSLNTQLKQCQLGGAIIPNFAIGAVLMMRFAREAAAYFDHVEVIELHHNRKKDAPSGTAAHTAQSLSQHHAHPFNVPRVEETQSIEGARGAQLTNGVRVHSVRLPGLVAHQEVLFAGEGELLSLRHDSFNRLCFMPGVLRAIRGVVSHTGLVVGLEAYL
ncbi:MAG: 4-hydroxy-tetrahydrodipicolinate reductase [Vampirovibrionales bacterium]